MEPRGFLVAGQEIREGEVWEVRAPFDNRLLGAVHRTPGAWMEQALARAEEAHRRRVLDLPKHRKIGILENLVHLLRERREEITRLLAQEVAKPLKWAYGEVDRAINNAESALGFLFDLRFEALPLDFTPPATGKFGLVRRFPVGPVLAITPFNFPLNLPMHKVLPALVAGTPLILKPAPQAPLTGLTLGHLLLEAGWPPEALSVVLPTNEDAEAAVKDPRVALLSFTGSARVGWHLKRVTAARRVLLELGGNAAVVVEPDADLDKAAHKVAVGGYAYAGQVCISIQRVLVHRDIYETFRARLLEEVSRLKTADPLDPEADLSAMISDREADRAWSWIQEALDQGARSYPAPPRRRGRILEPVVLEQVPEHLKVWNEEVFAPVVVLRPYETFEEALDLVNRSAYGLQAGVFTRDLHKAWQAFEALEVGGVILNDSPTFRVDPMPYGGVKASGLGREGIRYAYEEYTEPRLLVWKGSA